MPRGGRWTRISWREREQIVDQAGHARRLSRHDGEEAVAGHGIIAGGALEGFDEAAQRGERGAQFVAGVGDEVGAHLGELVLLGKVAEGDEEERQTGPGLALGDARERGEETPLDGDAFVELDGDRLGRGGGGTG